MSTFEFGSAAHAAECGCADCVRHEFQPRVHSSVCHICLKSENDSTHYTRAELQQRAAMRRKSSDLTLSENAGSTDGQNGIAEFSVCQFFKDETHEYVRRFVCAEEAINAALHYMGSVGAQLGTTRRVIITDGGDCVNFEWIFGKGVVFPAQRVEVSASHAPYITVTEGMRGWFAAQLSWNPDMDGFYEPSSTSPASHANKADAQQEAIEWAKAEEMEYRA